jgi:rhodanese-related sulfurtransferase
VVAFGLTVGSVVAARTIRPWTAAISVQYPDVSWVDGETLSNWMGGSSDEELVLLDVRTPEEQRVSHLQDARLVDARNPNIGALTIPASATVVVYCSMGYRSASIIEELERAGIQNIYNLEGGLFAWANADRPIYRGAELTHGVHPFNGAWGMLLRSDLRAED